MHFKLTKCCPMTAVGKKEGKEIQNIRVAPLKTTNSPTSHRHQHQRTHSTTNSKDADKYIRPSNWKRGQQRKDLNVRQSNRFSTVGRINFSFVRQRDQDIYEKSSNTHNDTGDSNGIVFIGFGNLVNKSPNLVLTFCIKNLIMRLKAF